MITSARKQNDKEVETSFVHLMQMYMFVIEVLQKSKYLYLPGTPLGGRKHLNFFLHMYNCLVVRQERCDIYNVGVHRIVICIIRPDLPDIRKKSDRTIRPDTGYFTKCSKCEYNFNISHKIIRHIIYFQL